VAARTASETSVPPFPRRCAPAHQFHVAEDVFEHDDAVVDEPGEASARPPRIMVLMVPPSMFAISMHASIESGTDSITATVARGLPRNSRIMMPVSTSPMPASFDQLLQIASLTKTD
jgi:hypothetical protein